MAGLQPPDASPRFQRAHTLPSSGELQVPSKHLSVESDREGLPSFQSFTLKDNDGLPRRESQGGQPGDQQGEAQGQGQQEGVADEWRDLGDAVHTLPARDSLSEEERLSLAAVCLARAMESLPPLASRPGQHRLFLALHSHYYRKAVFVLMVLHVGLAYREAPPFMAAHSNQQLHDAGYWAVWKTSLVDALICIAYDLHCMLVFRVEGFSGGALRNALFVVVLLLNVDMVVGATVQGVRPFRCIRPLVYAFTHTQQAIMLRSCVETLAALTKTFVLLLFGILFYAVVGLALFSGNAATDATAGSANIFGAACWEHSGERHPFANFGFSFVSMYVLATTENFPEILWPFYSCGCTFVGSDGSSQSWATEDHCTARHVVSVVFFVSYIVLVFFCLGNSVLGVCYVWFEKIMRRNVIMAGLQQRFSLIAAFYYLEQDQKVTPDVFLKCVSVLRAALPGMAGSNDGDELFFRYLDADMTNTLSLEEFFKVGELLRANVVVHKARHRLGAYQKWKDSTLRTRLVRLVEFRVRSVVVLDLAMAVMLLANFALAAIESTRGDTQRTFSNATTWVLVVEALVKASGYGFKGYWLSFWNKLDCLVAMASVAALVAEASTSGFQYWALIDCLRLLRFLKFVHLLTSFRQEEARQEDSNNPNAQAEQEGFYVKLLESLAMAVPVTANVLLLLFFYMFFMAMLGMEAFSSLEANSKWASVQNGDIDFGGNEAARYDWGDTGSALLSVFIISVGNDWNDVMYRAQEAEGGFPILLFFLVLHFVGLFLLLNIIQSLFVFTFSTFLNHRAFESTVEFQIRQNLEKLHKISQESFKKIARVPKLEFLLLSHSELDQQYNGWLADQYTPGVPVGDEFVDFGTSRLLISPISSFLCYGGPPVGSQLRASQRMSGRLLERVKSLQRNIRMGEVLQSLGAKPDNVPKLNRRMTSLTSQANSPRQVYRRGSLARRNSKQHGTFREQSGSFDDRRGSATAALLKRESGSQKPPHAMARSNTSGSERRMAAEAAAAALAVYGNKPPGVELAGMEDGHRASNRRSTPIEGGPLPADVVLVVQPANQGGGGGEGEGEGGEADMRRESDGLGEVEGVLQRLFTPSAGALDALEEEGHHEEGHHEEGGQEAKRQEPRGNEDEQSGKRPDESEQAADNPLPTPSEQGHNDSGEEELADQGNGDNKEGSDQSDSKEGSDRDVMGPPRPAMRPLERASESLADLMRPAAMREVPNEGDRASTSLS